MANVVQLIAVAPVGPIAPVGPNGPSLPVNPGIIIELDPIIGKPHNLHMCD